MLLRYVGAVLLLLCSATPDSPGALTFDFTPAAGTSSQAITGFQEAAGLWTSLLFDDITVNIDIDFLSLGSGILGSTLSTEGSVSYAGWTSALDVDRQSAADDTATANLQSGSSVDLYINHTAGQGNPAAPYVDSDGDANNTTIRLTSANAKAVGLLSPDAPGQDASIEFSSDFSWDFDRSDGITSGMYDFVGIAAHEIGHALGFISGVDILDANTSPPHADSEFTFVSPLDLYRYSDSSVLNGVIDWTADAREKYFSIDGGANSLATFSTGVNFGDGHQASHWEDDLAIGIMDPTAATAEMLTISDIDILAFDVIGYDLVPVPEAQGFAMVSVVLIALQFQRRRSHRA